MRWLMFLSRLAFICGLFFLAAFSLLLKNWLSDPTIMSTVINIGYTMGIIILPFTILCYIFTWIIRKRLRTFVPAWLIVCNFLFLGFLIYFIFYLNDPFYHQG